MLISLLSLAAFLPSFAYGEQVSVVERRLADEPQPPTLKVASADLRASRRPIPLATANTPGNLRFIENSGVCETTPNVYQASGYGDLSATDSMWFWFFAARSNPDTAPLTLWFNGGPGSSSMVGIFKEHGPCRITNDSSNVVFNPYSWNNQANMLYIDQPIGTGFSHGDTSRVGTSQEAAEDVWSFLQIFLSDPKFSQFQTRDLAIWTESFGGHYGPTFAAHFLDQNAAIANGSISGLHINLKTLGIGNGHIDPLIQYPQYAEYVASNPYRVLASPDDINIVNISWTGLGGCQDQIQSCYDSNGANTTACSGATNFCNKFIQRAYTSLTDFNRFFVPMPSNDSYPPSFTKYLVSVQDSLGVDQSFGFGASSDEVSNAFAASGDWMTNTRPHLETVIAAGVKTILYDGDADFVFNYMGVEAMIDSMNTTTSAGYKTQTFQNYMVAGQQAGLIKQSGNFAYIRVFGAGHEVPAYKFGTLDYGQAASQIFEQFTVTIPANQTGSAPPGSPAPNPPPKSGSGSILSPNLHLAWLSGVVVLVLHVKFIYGI